VATLNPLILRVRYPFGVNKYINRPSAIHSEIDGVSMFIAEWSHYATPSLTSKNSTF
jgi:hypothetical protein